MENKLYEGLWVIVHNIPYSEGIYLVKKEKLEKKNFLTKLY